MATIQKRSLVDQVYERLRGDIIALRLPLGSKINVNELQDTLGVSCTPIREAINRLQQEGLITYENNVGAHVLDLTGQDVTEILQLATTLHCAAARLAMERGDHGVMAAQLREQIEAFRHAELPQDHAKAVHHLIEVFYRHCGNRRLDRSMLSIQGQQVLLRNVYAGFATEKEADLADLERICRSVEENDVDALCAALTQNAHRMELCVSAAIRDGKLPG